MSIWQVHGLWQVFCRDPIIFAKLLYEYSGWLAIESHSLWPEVAGRGFYIFLCNEHSTCCPMKAIFSNVAKKQNIRTDILTIPAGMLEEKDEKQP